MKYKQLIIGHLLTLSTGSVIYILFRSKSLKMFSWFTILKINNQIDYLRSKVQEIHLIDWVKYSLPDGLWIFSYISLILFIWNNQLKRENLLWIFCIPIIAIFSEILQGIHLLQGTFDLVDLLMYLLGAILPFASYNKLITFKQV